MHHRSTSTTHDRSVGHRHRSRSVTARSTRRFGARRRRRPDVWQHVRRGHHHTRARSRSRRRPRPPAPRRTPDRGPHVTGRSRRPTRRPPDARAGSTTRHVGLLARIALLLGGAAVVGLFVGVLLWNGLGPGPIDVFVVGLSDRTGLSLAATTWAVFGLVNVAVWAGGRRPRLGTVVAPTLAGWVVEASLAGLAHADRPDALLVRLVIQLGGIAAIGLGVAAVMSSDLGAGPSELLTSVISDATAWSETRSRLVLELVWLSIGTILGGPVGLGTAVVAMLIGSSVGLGRRAVDATITGPGVGPR